MLRTNPSSVKKERSSSTWLKRRRFSVSTDKKTNAMHRYPVLSQVFLTVACWRCFNDLFLYERCIAGVSLIRSDHSLSNVPRCRGISWHLSFVRSERVSFRNIFQNELLRKIEVHPSRSRFMGLLSLLCFVVFTKKCNFYNSGSWVFFLTPSVISYTLRHNSTYSR